MRSVDRFVLPPHIVERRLFGDSLPDMNAPHRPASTGAIEARGHLEKARLAFEAQRKNNMPDLKSELSKVINSWETDMPTTTPQIGRKITTNSTRITFNYVRDNPGVNRHDAIKALLKMGVKESSSTSLITVMLARGNLRTVNDGLFATQAEYVPLPKVKPKAKKAKPAPVVEAPKAPEPVQISTTWSAEAFINTLSVKQALALYNELRTIFGG